MIVLFKGAELRDTQKTQVIKRLASPQTSFGVRSSRIHFSPKSVRERWMRDERTSKDVWGEAIKRYAGIRFKQSRAVNPQRLQILRIDREGMKRHDVICAKKKNVWKRCCWNCNIWPDRFTSNQSHYRSYYSGIPEFVMKRWIYINSKIAQTTQINIWNFTIYMKCKLRRLSGRFHTLIRETGRNGSKSRVSRIIRESWQHCKGCSVRLSDDYLTV